MIFTFEIDDSTYAALERWLDSDYNLRMQHFPNGESRRVRNIETVEEVLRGDVSNIIQQRVNQAPPDEELQALLDEQKRIQDEIENKRKPNVRVDNDVVQPNRPTKRSK
jgi:hypothetical protein